MTPSVRWTSPARPVRRVGDLGLRRDRLGLDAETLVPHVGQLFGDLTLVALGDDVGPEQLPAHVAEQATGRRGGTRPPPRAGSGWLSGWVGATCLIVTRRLWHRHGRCALAIVSEDDDSRNRSRQPRAAHRLSGIPETIFATMSALAVRTGAINLGQGFPDEEGPQSVAEAAVTAIRSHRNQYAPGIGVPELRRAIAAHQRRHYGLDIDPDTRGAGHRRCDRGAGGGDPGVHRPRGRGRRPRAVLRLLRRLHRDGRRGAPTGDAAPARLPARRPGPAVGGEPAHQVPAGEQPPQPDRSRPHCRRAPRDRRRRRRARPAGRHRRGLRAPDLRRGGARPAGDAARGCTSAPSRSPAPGRATRSPAGRSAGSPVRPSWCARCSRPSSG